MDGNIQKALWLGVSILLFIAVVMIGMSMFQSSQEMAAQGSAAINDTSRELSNAQFGIYDNKEVSGSDVSSAVNKFKRKTGEIQVIVDNNGGGPVSYVSGGTAATALTAMTDAVINTSIQNSQDKTQTGLYINPYGEFYATLIYDTNDEVRAISFVQQ